MSEPVYKVNLQTGDVVKDDGSGWKPVTSARNKQTGQIVVDEGGGWGQLVRSQDGSWSLSNQSTSNPQAPESAVRARGAMDAGLPIDKGDLNTLTRPNFQPLTPAQQAFAETPQARFQQQQFEDQRQREGEAVRVPDSNLKERSLMAVNGPTWGNAPRVMAGMQTVGALAATPFVEGDIIDQKGISGASQQFLKDARVHQRRAREERPGESFALEIVPALFQGKTLLDVVGKKLLPKATALQNTARVVGTGAVGGATYMASQNESGTPEGVLSDAGTGALYGAAGGAAFKGAEMPARVAYRSAKTGAANISDALSAAMGRVGTARDSVAEQIAVAAVNRSAARADLTMDQMMELVKKYEGKPAVLAEVIGQDAINALTALTRGLGKTSQKAQDIIEERSYGWYDRAKGDIEDATGFVPGQVDDIVEQGMAAGREKARPFYESLFGQFKDVKSFPESLKRVNRLLRSPGMERHKQLAEEAVRNASAKRNIPLSKMSKMEYFDLIKQSLDDAIDSAVSKGENRTRIGESVRDLTELKGEFVKELDRLTAGAYSAAREAGGEAPRLRQAAVEGQKAFGARNPRAVEQTVQNTTEEALPALRAGMVDDLATRIDKGSLIPGRFRRPDVAGKVNAVFGEESGSQLISKMDAEATLRETGARWAPRMNSVTGTVMESGPTQMGDDLVNAGMNILTGNKLGLFRQAINFARQRGFSQRQLDSIGDLLLSDPADGLRRLGRMRPDGSPSIGGQAARAQNALAPSSGGASGELTPQGTGNALAPRGPVRGAGVGKGTRTADLAAIGALTTAPPAKADTGDGSAELQAVKDRVSQIETTAIPELQEQRDVLRDPNSDPVEKQRILLLRGYPLGTTGPAGDGVDGVIGKKTRDAIIAEAKKIEGEIGRAQEELNLARDSVTQLEMRAAQENAQSSRGNELFGKVSPWVGTAAGIYLGYRTRGGAVKKSDIVAKDAARTANALLNSKSVTRGVNAPRSANTRAANLNDFWRQGGAGENVPFTTTTTGKNQGKFRARPNAAEPSALFPSPPRFNSQDAAIVGTGLVEGGVSHLGMKDQERKIKEAKADVEKYAAAGDVAGMQRALKKQQSAEVMHSMFVMARNAGLLLSVSRVTAGLKKPYAKPTPDIAAAERERALVLQSMKK